MHTILKRLKMSGKFTITSLLFILFYSTATQTAPYHFRVRLTSTDGRCENYMVRSFGASGVDGGAAMLNTYYCTNRGVLKFGTGDKWIYRDNTIRNELKGAVGKMISARCANGNAELVVCKSPAKTGKNPNYKALRHNEDLEWAWRKTYKPYNELEESDHLQAKKYPDSIDETFMKAGFILFGRNILPSLPQAHPFTSWLNCSAAKSKHSKWKDVSYKELKSQKGSGQKATLFTKQVITPYNNLYSLCKSFGYSI